MVVWEKKSKSKKIINYEYVSYFRKIFIDSFPSSCYAEREREREREVGGDGGGGIRRGLRMTGDP